MRWIYALAVLALCQAACFAQELQTTTEFEVTITPQNVMDGLEEMQQFWTPVLRYIASEQFAKADAEGRKQAAAFFNRLHDSLYKQLFEADEATARDLLDYFCLRLRRIALYKRLREATHDDAALVTLIDCWEKAFRDINQLPQAERPARVEAMLKLLPGEMATLGLSAETSQRAIVLWNLQAKCMMRMSETKAGALIASFERDARRMERPVGELLREIASASDWVLITKEAGKPVGRADFDNAWKRLAELRGQPRTVAVPGATR